MQKLNPSSTMKSTWLVQRLQRPHQYEGKFAGLENMFSFGGGLKNGGLSDEAMGLLKDIFRFDYMGSAEFEFGAVPETFQKIAKQQKDYIGFGTVMKYNYKPFNPQEEIKVGTATVYVICRASERDEVTARVQRFATSSYHDTKERIQLDSALGGDKYDKDLIGWLELDNGFMFFTDKIAYQKTIQLFSIKEQVS